MAELWKEFVSKAEDTPLVVAGMEQWHALLSLTGLPPPYPGVESVLLGFLAGIYSLILYYVFFGRRHSNRRMRLQNELDRAQAKIDKLRIQSDELKEQLSMEVFNEGSKDGKQIRVWMDGAFDMMHYGHMNAFRQGRALGTYLVVGINSDASITECKGTAPVMSDEERVGAVSGCKWVDEVVPGAPYVMNKEYLDMVIKKYKIDYVVHGDDPCFVDGVDAYADSKARGIFKSIPRTEGVSTTDIVGRMLLFSKKHHMTSQVTPTIRSRFLTTSLMLRIFSAGVKAPAPGARVVYVDGAFDMFHAGHVEFLRRAREQGDYLIAGVLSDAVVNEQRGSNHPIMNLNERVLSVLGCRCVDDVLIDAPLQLTREMLSSLAIDVVVHGTQNDLSEERQESNRLRYKIAQDLGVVVQLESPTTLNVSKIVGRILKNEATLQAKVDKKSKVEEEYYSQRYGFDVTEQQ